MSESKPNPHVQPKITAPKKVISGPVIHESKTSSTESGEFIQAGQFSTQDKARLVAQKASVPPIVKAGGSPVRTSDEMKAGVGSVRPIIKPNTPEKGTAGIKPHQKVQAEQSIKPHQARVAGGDIKPEVPLRKQPGQRPKAVSNPADFDASRTYNEQEAVNLDEELNAREPEASVSTLIGVKSEIISITEQLDETTELSCLDKLTVEARCETPAEDSRRLIEQTSKGTAAPGQIVRKAEDVCTDEHFVVDENDITSLPEQTTASRTVSRELSKPEVPASGTVEAKGRAVNKSGENDALPESWLDGSYRVEMPDNEFLDPNLMPSELEFEEDEAAADWSKHPEVGLEKHLGLPQELQAIIDGYDDEIRYAKMHDGMRECAIQLAIARILEYTGYEKLAYVRYLRALDANHFSRTVIHELRRIARAYNKTKDVITLLQSEIDTNITAEEQATLLEECALLTYFSDPNLHDEAITMLYRACSLSPKLISPVCSLFHLLIFERRVPEVISTLDTIIGLTDDVNVQVACHCMKGDFESSANPGHMAGLDSYQCALELKPGHLYSFQHAMSIFIRHNNWQSLYSRVLAFSNDTKDKTVAHSALLLAGSIALDHLADFVGSNSAYERAIALFPEDTLPLELRLDNYTNEPARWKELDEVLIRLIETTNITREKHELTILRAINMDTNGKSPDKAVEILEELFSEGPVDRLVMEYCQELLYRDGGSEKAMAFTRRFAEMAPAQEAASRYSAMGCYCFDVLKKFDEAEGYFKRALELFPSQRTAFDYLENIYRSKNNFDGLSRIYRARLDVTQDARNRASILHTLATLYDYVFSQPENAISYYRQYREIYPNDIHVIHNLERLAVRMKNWKEEIELLLYEKNVSPSAPERANLLVRIAYICRYKMHNLQYAASFLKQARTENPTSLSIFRELEEVLREAKNWKELTNILNEQLAVTRKPQNRVHLLNSLAQIYENRLQESNYAVTCYEEILKIEPDNMIAGARLDSIYRRTGNLAGYYELALARSKNITVPRRKCQLLFKVALKTLTLFNEPEQAISILEMALNCDPEYTPVVFLLTLLYGATSRVVELSNLLQDFTNTTKNQGTKSACAVTLAFLQTCILNNPDDAVHPLELALALSPESIEARIMLLHAQYARSNYGEVSALFAEGALNQKDKYIAAHDYNMSAFFAHVFSNLAGAFDTEVSSLKSCVELMPDDWIANERLEAMEPCRANLVPFIEKRVKTASFEDKVELELALVESTFPVSSQEAFAKLCRIIEDCPSHLPALRIGANMAEKLNNPTMLCRFLALQAETMVHRSMQTTTWFKAAKVALKQLNQPQTAIEYLRKAFMIAPQRMDICDMLLELLRQKKDLAAIDCVVQFHLKAIKPEERNKRYLQISDIYINDFADPGYAAVKLRQMINVDPDNVEAQWKLANIELAQQHWQEARRCLENLLDFKAEDQELEIKARLCLAELYAEHLGAPENAVPLLQAVMTAKADDVRAIEMMVEICKKAGKYNEALSLLLRLNKLVEPPENFRILIKLAEVYKVINNQDKYLQVLKEAIALAEMKPELLKEIKEKVSNIKDPAVLKGVIGNIISLKNLSQDAQIEVYEFAVQCYCDVLNMKAEADKYSIAAAVLAPNSLRARLLAAQVQDSREAMKHALAAAELSPLSAEPYQAMHRIACASGQLDLQIRLEQQLISLSSKTVQPNVELLKRFTKRFPERPNSIDENLLLSTIQNDINLNILELLQLAGPKIQIFELAQLPGQPISNAPALASLFNNMALTFGLPDLSAKLVLDAPYIFSMSMDSPNEIMLNATALSQASEPETRFHLACAIMHVKLNTLPILVYPPENIAMLISGLIGLYDERLSSPSVLNSIKAVLPRNNRKAVSEYIAKVGVQALQFEPRKLQAATVMIDTAIGHIFSADLAASVAAIIRRKSPLSPLPATNKQWMMACASMPQIMQLFAYNCSKQYTELRQKLGVLIK